MRGLGGGNSVNFHAGGSRTGSPAQDGEDEESGGSACSEAQESILGDRNHEYTVGHNRILVGKVVLKG